MSSQDHRSQWKPPARPEWVQRINEEGYCMDIKGVVPLDEASLLASATRATGLNDFGDEHWREPFRILLQSLDEESELNLMGRIRSRSELLQLLQARLQIEETYKRHPEIDQEIIRQPIIVVGQGRSGTSLLTNVLAHDPNNGALMQWQATFPCPPPETASLATDPRIEQAHRLIEQWIRVTPTLATMHEFRGDLPMECTQILALAFRSQTWFDCLGQVPAYDRYMGGQDPDLALAYHERVLKLLQWRAPRRHWVLKDPMHLYRLPQLMKRYPDACIAWPHRDPVRALASVVNMVGTLQWGRSDHPFKGGSFEYVTDPAVSAAGLNHVIDQLESRVVPAKQIFHLLYQDLVTDTMPTIRRMYEHFGLPLDSAGDRAMQKYLLAFPREARPPHRFSAGPDEAISHARQVYRRYQEHFRIPVE